MGKEEEGGESFKKINKTNQNLPQSTLNVLDNEEKEYFLNDMYSIPKTPYIKMEGKKVPAATPGWPPEQRPSGLICKALGSTDIQKPAFKTIHC